MTKFNAAEHIIKLQGKDYLPVAARIVWMRSEHDDWSIVTEPVHLGDSLYMRATIATGDGRILATAHKAASGTGRRGAGASYPVESAETGAIGRALGMCGYGTLSGDLDEGEEIADTPVNVPAANGKGKPARVPISPVDVAAVIDQIMLAQSADELDAAKAAARSAWPALGADERARVQSEIETVEAFIANMADKAQG